MRIVLFFVALLAVGCFAGAGVSIAPPDATIADFIVGLVNLVADKCPEEVNFVLSIVGALSFLMQFIPDNQHVKYADKRWYQWITWVLHRFGMNNLKARNEST